MIKIILELSTDWDVLNISSAEYILSGIEEVGMLPPNELYTNSDDDLLKELYNKWEEE